MSSTEAGKRLLDALYKGRTGGEREAIATIEVEARAAVLARVRERVEGQHRRVETLNSDGDDWLGCLCGEPDDDCAVLAILEEES